MITNCCNRRVADMTDAPSTASVDQSDELSEIDAIAPDPYPWETYDSTHDERRRAMIFAALADWQVDGKILASNCWVMEQWMKTGQLIEPPPAIPQPAVRRSKL